MPLHTLASARAECASRIRWGDLAGREYGPRDAAGRTFVFLHGLTFDRLMWDPVLDALPAERHSIAFDLPGHGSSPMAPRPGLAAVVEALHAAVLETGLEAPIMVGHSIGGPIATLYAATHPAAGVVSPTCSTPRRPRSCTGATTGCAACATRARPTSRCSRIRSRRANVPGSPTASPRPRRSSGRSGTTFRSLTTPIASRPCS